MLGDGRLEAAGAPPLWRCSYPMCSPTLTARSSATRPPQIKLEGAGSDALKIEEVTEQLKAQLKKDEQAAAAQEEEKEGHDEL